jgi:preprotein translocase subunit YajC
MEGIGAFLPLILIFGVFYLLLIRPQQKKIKLHREMLNNIKRGDKVITSGGIIGKVTKVNENKELSIEISDQVEIKIASGMISDLYFTPENKKNQIEQNKISKPSLFSNMFSSKKKD